MKITPTSAAWWATLLAPIALVVAVFLPAVHAANYVQAASVLVAGIWAAVLAVWKGSGPLATRIVTALEGLVTAIVTALEELPTAIRDAFRVESTPLATVEQIDPKPLIREVVREVLAEQTKAAPRRRVAK